MPTIDPKLLSNPKYINIGLHGDLKCIGHGQNMKLYGYKLVDETI